MTSAIPLTVGAGIFLHSDMTKSSLNVEQINKCKYVLIIRTELQLKEAKR